MATEGISTRPRDSFNLNQAEEGAHNTVSTVKKKKEANAARVSSTNPESTRPWVTLRKGL